MIPLVILAWLILCGFTMRVEWIMPDDSNHDYFIMEYCRTSANAKNCLRSGNGWKLFLTIADKDTREILVTEEAAGQHCYRLQSGAGLVEKRLLSGPSSVKCGYN